ncbi:MAG: hypothetical protein ABI539_05055 [Acidobacteriota bacterium]
MGDKNEEEFVTKVKYLVHTRFGGSYIKAFEHYAMQGKPSGSIGPDELVALLKDADIGNALTRGTWANAIIERLDRNRNGRIEYPELEIYIAAPDRS